MQRSCGTNQGMSKPKASKVFLWFYPLYPFGPLASQCFPNLANSFPLQRRPWATFPRACPVVSLPPTRQPLKGSALSQHCLRLRMEPLIGRRLKAFRPTRWCSPWPHSLWLLYSNSPPALVSKEVCLELGAWPNSAVLNLWVVTPLGINQPFQKGHVSDFYIMIHNSSNVIVMR